MSFIQFCIIPLEMCCNVARQVEFTEQIIQYLTFIRVQFEKHGTYLQVAFMTLSIKLNKTGEYLLWPIYLACEVFRLSD